MESASSISLAGEMEMESASSISLAGEMEMESASSISLADEMEMESASSISLAVEMEMESASSISLAGEMEMESASSISLAGEKCSHEQLRMRNRFHLLGRKCSVWERDVVYRPARTPGCPVLRVCCLPPVWSRVPRFFAGSDPQGHAATRAVKGRA